tara:strand:- start:211 stop:372 length:162 start_codon:yes stop_codon:yes gene_type:complete
LIEVQLTNIATLFALLSIAGAYNDEAYNDGALLLSNITINRMQTAYNSQTDKI